MFESWSAIAPIEQSARFIESGPNLVGLLYRHQRDLMPIYAPATKPGYPTRLHIRIHYLQEYTVHQITMW